MLPMIAAFRERNQFMTDKLNAIPGFRCLLSGGAFYAFVDANQAIQNLTKQGLIATASDIDFSEYLLEKSGVAVVPGSAFGCNGYIRLSFATSMDNLTKAMDRLKKLLA